MAPLGPAPPTERVIHLPVPSEALACEREWRCEAGSSRQGTPPVNEPKSLEGASDAGPEVEEGRGRKPRDDERRKVDLRSKLCNSYWERV